MNALRHVLLTAVVLALAAAGAPSFAGEAPSDDPADWPVDPAVEWRPVVGEPRFVVPSIVLPADLAVDASNNNCAIAFFEGRLFLAWRTAPDHFASPRTRMLIVSSADGGRSFEREAVLAVGADLREPSFIPIGGRLVFQCFQGGVSAAAFEPRRMLRTVRAARGAWSELEPFGEPGEVPWDVKVRGGRAWMTSYRGGHYHLFGDATIDLRFRVSDDGLAWRDVDPARPALYTGGASEAAFEFDEAGALWAVTRNEDGDATGFGAHLAWAQPGSPARWEFPGTSDPERYDSPELFRHGRDLWLVARRDVGGPFDRRIEASMAVRRVRYLAAYWLRPKRTALYRIDRARRAVVHVQDLPGAGDTAFPCVARTGPHSFLLANYTSPLEEPDQSWLRGQTRPAGTRIYLLEIRFEPAAAEARRAGE